VPDISLDATVGSDDGDVTADADVVGDADVAVAAPIGGKPDLSADPPAEPTADPTVPRWTLGASVRLRQRPAYLKTADPMPMLRPPDLIGVDEVGQVVELRAFGQVAVRFRRGSFLLAAASLEASSSEGVSPVRGPS
jgi:hypothetical protein